MNWKEMNKKAVIEFAKGNVRFIIDSNNFGLQYEVGEIDDYSTVTIKNLDGRTEFYCDCENGTRFCKSPTICFHRLSVILFCQRGVFK